MQGITNEKVRSYLAHFSNVISQELVDYATNVVFKESRYIFTHKEKTQQYGYCTHCGNTFMTYNLKHNEKTICPMCESECKVKDSFRGRKRLIDEAYFVFYEKSVLDPTVIVARGIQAFRDYRGDYRKVEIEYCTEAWYIFDMKKGSTMLKKPSWWSSSREPYITRSIQCLYHDHSQTYIKYLGYSRDSVRNAVSRTPFSWSGWESYDYKDMTKFFELYVKYPCIEYFTKLGFTSLVQDKLEGSHTYGAINWRGKDLFKILKITKQEFGEIKSQEVYVTYWFLHIYQLNKKNNWGLSIAETRDIAYRYKEYDFEELRKMLIYGDFKKITNYLNKQRNKNQVHYYSQYVILRDWRDYIEDCKKLEMDISKENILFPRDLYKAHQRTTKLIKYKADKELNEKIKARLESLEEYRFQYKGLIIRPAISTDELIKEGKILNHCVGGYAQNYANGITNILFIRKITEPDKPYYTVEIKDNQIMQVRGMKNCSPDEEVQAFIKAFKEKIRKKTKKKDSKKTKVSVPA